MAILYNVNGKEQSFQDRIKDCIADDFKHNAITTATDVFYSKRAALVDEVPEWEELREEARRIRNHVLDNLDYYLAQFAENAEKAGSHVYFAQTDKEAVEQVIEIFENRNAKKMVKSKSMVSEEIDINHALIDRGIEVFETDLAEIILQPNDWNPPSHIVVPALHLDRVAIRDVFQRYGYTGDEDPTRETKFIRGFIREKFLNADVGMTGCNFGVAETGTCTLVTNEGNGRMTTSVPNTQIILMGMERLVPSFEALDVMIALLVRSSVGSKITSYFSMTTGPRKADEVDGPEEQHIIIIDNGRSKILASEFREMLRCIRCGACLNICPVYRHITGHGYGSIYPGPMGVVLTPLLVGYDKAGSLPWASTLCGACSDHCPVKIPLHELILRHRQILVEEKGYGKGMQDFVFTAAGTALAHEKLFNLGTKVGARMMPLLAKDRKTLKEDTKIPVLKNWTQSRDMDTLSKEKFRDWFKKHEAEKKGGK